jgi:hypothetical protein
MADEPNQGAAGDTTEVDQVSPDGDAGPAGAGAPINQGAAGAGPEGGSAYDPGASAYGESPRSVGSSSDFLDERPEVAVGGAFLAGFVVAQILKKVGE